jgi:hypothetical protein
MYKIEITFIIIEKISQSIPKLESERIGYGESTKLGLEFLEDLDYKAEIRKSGFRV